MRDAADRGQTISINHVMVVGAGWVGRQIAARLAQYGVRVFIGDRNESVLKDAFLWLERAAQDHPIIGSASPRSGQLIEGSWISLLEPAPPLQTLIDNPEKTADLQIDLVLECVPEQLSIKRRVLKQLSVIFAPPTILCSNSSYFVPSLLSPYIEHPERYAHMHFHVPVLNDSIADIVGCPQTERSVLNCLEQFISRIGLEALLLRKEHPGYVFNWMLQSLLKSALELVALDVVDPEDVDKSWKSVTGMPLGPFGIMDQIGLDVIEQVLANARWAEDIQPESAELLKLVQEHTRKGHLGTKSHQGFYRYEDDMPLMPQDNKRSQ